MFIGLLYALLLAVVSYGLGRTFFLKFSFNDPWEESLFAIGLGLGLISLILLLLGLFKLLYPPVFIGFSVLGFALSSFHLKKFIGLRFSRYDLTFLALLILVIGVEATLVNWSP